MSAHETDARLRAYFRQHPEELQGAAMTGFISPVALKAFRNTSARTAEETTQLARELNKEAKERRTRKDREHEEKLGELATRRPAAAGSWARAIRTVPRELDPTAIYRARHAGGGAR
jgi:hypothetical protein